MKRNQMTQISPEFSHLFTVLIFVKPNALFTSYISLNCPFTKIYMAWGKTTEAANTAYTQKMYIKCSVIFQKQHAAVMSTQMRKTPEAP